MRSWLLTWSRPIEYVQQHSSGWPAHLHWDDLNHSFHVPYWAPWVWKSSKGWSNEKCSVFLGMKLNGTDCLTLFYLGNHWSKQEIQELGPSGLEAFLGVKGLEGHFGHFVIISSNVEMGCIDWGGLILFGELPVNNIPKKKTPCVIGGPQYQSITCFDKVQWEKNPLAPWMGLLCSGMGPTSEIGRINIDMIWMVLKAFEIAINWLMWATWSL